MWWDKPLFIKNKSFEWMEYSRENIIYKKWFSLQYSDEIYNFILWSWHSNVGINLLKEIRIVIELRYY